MIFAEMTGTTIPVVSQIASEISTFTCTKSKATPKKGTCVITKNDTVDTKDANGIHILDNPTATTYFYDFDKTTCSVRIGLSETADASDSYFVIANSGKTMYGVNQKVGKSTSSQFVATKQ